MLCCVGLISGMSVGQSMGGPWTYIAPAVGFGVGFLGDMKFMGHMHKKNNTTPVEPEVKNAQSLHEPVAAPSDAKPAVAWELAA